MIIEIYPNYIKTNYNHYSYIVCKCCSIKVKFIWALNDSVRVKPINLTLHTTLIVIFNLMY